jgi:polyvinyl alcohol dehydrogenase (cytochrome)
MLKNLPNGKSVLIAAQKSGVVWAHDPDRKGAVVWKTSVASTTPGPAGQLNFGGSADDRNAYFGVHSGGVVALAIANGERTWFTPMEPAQGRNGGQDAAVSTIPGVVFSGGWDGVLRALSAANGAILWQFDMLREFDTVNRVPAQGGSMGASGPTVAGGMVFAGAGYPGVQNGRNGNVLLAFGVD